MNLPNQGFSYLSYTPEIYEQIWQGPRSKMDKATNRTFEPKDLEILKPYKIL